jgi:hypothetical protein
VGQGGTILSSANGIDWVPENSGTVSPLAEIAFGNGLFAVVGAGNSVLTSSNGSLWTLRPTAAVGGLVDVAYGNGRFVAATYELTSPVTNVYIVTSTDGVVWENLEPVSPSEAAIFFSCCTILMSVTCPPDSLPQRMAKVGRNTS